jgi:hypothetical protein
MEVLMIIFFLGVLTGAVCIVCTLLLEETEQ